MIVRFFIAKNRWSRDSKQLPTKVNILKCDMCFLFTERIS